MHRLLEEPFEAASATQLLTMPGNCSAWLRALRGGMRRGVQANVATDEPKHFAIKSDPCRHEVGRRFGLRWRTSLGGSRSTRLRRKGQGALAFHNDGDAVFVPEDL